MMANLRGARRSEEVVEAAAAYDVLAPRYENLLSENPVIAHSARVSMELVSRAMSDREFLLEIGSGIGRETLELAGRGKRVIACDPSKESLRLLQDRASRRGLSHRIETRAIPARAYGNREVLDAFRPHFKLAGMWGVPAIIPPHYLHRLLTASGGLRTAWEDLDRRANSRWPFRLVGSHTGWLFVSRP